MRVRGALVSAALCGFFCSSYGQSLPRPNQDSADGKRRLAVVAGKVLSAETGLGLPKATVALYSMENRQRGRPLAVKTNEKGEYQFLRVPPGRYRISATRNGYVHQAYGESRNEGGLSSGTPIVVRPGQVLHSVDFHLIPGAVIEGRILDNDYEPLSGVKVSLSRVRTMGGKRTLALVEKAQTDDRGIYRLFGVPPGSYYLSATHRPSALPRAEHPTPVPTYFPGVLSPQEATKIDIPPGAEYAGADMVLREALSYSLRGTVVDADGSPITSVRLYCRKQAGEGWASQAAGEGTTDRAGNFEVTDLVPGEYLLSAYAKRGGRTLIGRAACTVSGKDVDGVVLVLGDGAEIQGKVIVEGSDEDSEPPQISVHVVPEEITPPIFRDRRAKVKEDWTFRITHIPPRLGTVNRQPAPGQLLCKVDPFEGNGSGRSSLHRQRRRSNHEGRSGRFA